MTNKPIMRDQLSDKRPTRQWVIPNPHFQANLHHEVDKWWLHNEDGPALLLYDITDHERIMCEVWMQYNQHYRLDGPTITFYDRSGKMFKEEWHHFDKEYDSFNEWLADAPLPKDEKVKLKLLFG